MNKSKKIFSVFLCLILVFSALPVKAGPAEETATAFKGLITYYDKVPTILIGKADNDHVILAKGADEPYGIASMSKLMTYYLIKQAIAEGKMKADQMVTISDHAASYNMPGSSNYGTKIGESISVENLLKGMMVVSGNDAACALAEAHSGSESQFAQAMNNKAKELGLKSMYFINASGLTLGTDYNRSSAKDLYALIRKILEEFPEIREYAKIKELDEPERNIKKQSTISQYMPNLKGIEGLKTGTSNEAKDCFAGLFGVKSSSTNINYEIITIVMGAPTKDARWRTTKELVDIAEGSFSPKTIVDIGQPIKKYEMANSKEGSVTLYPKESYDAFTYSHAKFDVDYHIQKGIKAPTKEGQVFGNIVISKDGKVLKEIDIISHKATRVANIFEKMVRGGQLFFGFLLDMIS